MASTPLDSLTSVLREAGYPDLNANIPDQGDTDWSGVEGTQTAIEALSSAMDDGYLPIGKSGTDPLAEPVIAPTLTAGTIGSLTPGEYTVGFTYTDAFSGETPINPSYTTTITLASPDDSIHVDAITPPAGVVNVVTYATEADGSTFYLVNVGDGSAFNITTVNTLFAQPLDTNTTGSTAHPVIARPTGSYGIVPEYGAGTLNFKNTFTGDVEVASDGTATVTGLQGYPMSNAAPTSGQGQIWNGTEYEPTDIAGTAPATYTVPGIVLTSVVPVADPPYAVITDDPLYGQIDHGSALPGGTPADGAQFMLDTEPNLYVGVSGTWTPVAGGGGGGGGSDASSTVKGISKLSVDPVSSTDPIAVGDNDSRMTDSRTPTGSAGGSLSGTYPNPTIADASDSTKGLTKLSVAPASGTNPIAVGDNDSRMTDSRTPTGSAGGDLSGTYPNPGVAKWNGVSISGTPADRLIPVASSPTAAAWGAVNAAQIQDVPVQSGTPTDKFILKYNSSANQWQFSAESSNILLGCRVENRVVTSVSDSTFTKISFDTEIFDSGGYHSTGTNPTRVTIPIGQAGYYLLIANCSMQAHSGSSATGIKQIAIKYNNTTNIALERTSESDVGVGVYLSTSCPYYMGNGDYAELEVWQNTGVDFDAGTTGGFANLSVIKIQGGGATIDYGTSFPGSPYDGDLFVRTDTTPPTLYYYDVSVPDWVAVGGGGSSITSGTSYPVSPSTGDLFIRTDTTPVSLNRYNGSTWDTIGDGVGLSSSLASGKLYVGNGSGVATAQTPSGDVTMDNAGAFTLANSGVTAGSYTSANITVDAKGRVTSVSNGSGGGGGGGTPTFVGARVYNTSSQSISSGSFNYINFDSERFDTDGFHDNSTNNSRLTIPTGKAGYYSIIGQLRFPDSTAGDSVMSVFINRTTEIVRTGLKANSWIHPNITTIYYLNEGDYVELAYYQNSGGSLNTDVQANYSPEFTIALIGV